MMTTRSYILTILTFFCTLTLFAENKLAILNGPEGFAFVRNGQSKDSKVVDTLFAEDFFYFQPMGSSQWAKVSAWKGRQIEGFVHISRVQEVEKLDTNKLKVLIIQILERHKVLADNFQSAWESKDSIAYTTAVRALELDGDTRYDPILDILPKYFCITNDIQVLQLFFATVWADRGSANEMPSFVIGDCFMCNPDLVIEQLTKIKNVEQKELIFDDIEWGLINHFNVEEEGISNNQDYNKLKARLDIERKKSGQ